MEILVTGGGGFIGRHLARRLIDCGHTVTVFDKIDAWSPGAAGEPNPPVRLITGDLLDPAAVRSALDVSSPRVVVHAAALVSTEMETGLSRCVEAARAGRSRRPLSPPRPGPT